MKDDSSNLEKCKFQSPNLFFVLVEFASTTMMKIEELSLHDDHNMKTGIFDC